MDNIDIVYSLSFSIYDKYQKRRVIFQNNGVIFVGSINLQEETGR